MKTGKQFNGDGKKIGTVYLIHLFSPFKHAKHYVGFVESTQPEIVEERLNQHYAGRGAKMLKACRELGISFDVMRIWVNVPQTFERRLKINGHVYKHCPECEYIKQQQKLANVKRTV